jgi:hypothetical protein
VKVRVNTKLRLRRPKRAQKSILSKTLTLTFAKINISLLAFFPAVSVRCEEPLKPQYLPDSPFHFGPFYDHFALTLGSGERSEALGPLFGFERSGTSSSFTFSPVFSLYRDPSVQQTELKVAYPTISFEKYGPEYRFHLFQVIAWSGGESVKGGDTKRTTFFPIYFRQTSPRPEDNYTAVVPFYGHLKNRFFRDDVFFVMLPLYVQSTKKGVTTENFVFPLFHLRHGTGVTGWQFWPLYGTEHKELTTSTNHWGDPVVSPGYDHKMAVWPLYFNNTLGIGSTNLQKQFVLLPFYTSQVSTTRVSKSYGFPLGVTHTIDREAKYEEWDAPWPLVEFAKGEGKKTRRVFPFFSESQTRTAESDFYAWPIYKYNRTTAPPLNRERTRILLFLYSDLLEQNTTNNTTLRKRDFFPLFTWRKDHQNNTRLQVLSIIEPVLPGNKSIERIYEPLYAFYREEHNGVTGDNSRSVLWNLYRSEKRGEIRRQRAFFGLFQREKNADRTKWRIFFIPFTTRKHNTEGA